MNALLPAAVANAALAVPLAALAYATGRLTSRPALAHALWVLVLLKLLTPPLLDVPVIPAHLAPRLPVSAASPTPEPPPAAVAAALDTPEVEQAAPPAWSFEAACLAPPSAPERTSPAAPRPAAATPPLSSERPPEPAPLETRAPPPEPVPFGPILSAIWLLGIVLVLCVQAIRLIRFRRFARLAAESPELQRQAAALAAEMGMRTPPRVRVLPGVVSPMLWGVGPWATILFPARLAERLDEDGRGALLAHELAHHGRGDQWVRLLELAAGALYWWHPAVWLARRGIEAAGEDCADAWVVERFRSRPRCYAAALLDAVDFLAAGPSAVVPAATGLGTAAALRHRLTRIMQGPAPRVLSRPARAAVLILLLTLPLQPAIFEMTGSRSLAAVGTELDPIELFAPESEAEPTASSISQRRPDVVPMPEPLAPLPRDHVWAAAASPDGRFTLEVRLDGTATLHDVLSGETTVLPFPGLVAADFSPNGSTLAVADEEGRVSLRNLDTGTAADLPVAGRAVRSLAYSPDGSRIATAGDEGIAILGIEDGSRNPLPPTGGPATCVRYSPDGKRIAVVTGGWSGGDGRVLSWDGRAWRSVETTSPAAVARYTPDGLVVAGWDGRAALHDPMTEALLGTATTAKDAVSAAAFCEDAAGLDGLSFSPRPDVIASGLDLPEWGFGTPLFGGSPSRDAARPVPSTGRSPAALRLPPSDSIVRSSVSAESRP